jgi:hypothetical protein
VLAIDGPSPRAIDLEARVDGSDRWVRLARIPDVAKLARTPAGWSVPLEWPTTSMVADRLRVTLTVEDGAGAFSLDHFALYPRAKSARR